MDKRTGKAPKSTPLFDVEQWQLIHSFSDAILNSAVIVTEEIKTPKNKRLIATLHRGKPYALAKSLKIQEELKNYPKGTFFKIVKHPTI